MSNYGEIYGIIDEFHTIISHFFCKAAKRAGWIFFLNFIIELAENYEQGGEKSGKSNQACSSTVPNESYHF